MSDQLFFDFFSEFRSSGKKVQIRQCVSDPDATSMPSKRRYSESLTGGTGDVNPQSLIITGTFSNADAIKAIGTPLPIPRFSSSGNKSLVFEFLDVEWQIVDPPQPGPANGDFGKLELALATSASYPGTLNDWMADKRVISQYRATFQTIATVGPAAGAWQIVTYGKELQGNDDLTDRAGHGILIGTDDIYVWIWLQAQNYNWQSNFVCTIKYRIKEVTIQEYVGIVQSQQ